MTTLSHSNESASEKPCSWLTEAAVNTLSGVLLGVITSVFVVLASHVLFPSLADFDYDVGLRMQTWANVYLRLGATSMLPSKSGGDSYVFVDVDPRAIHSPTTSSVEAGASGPSATEDACTALYYRYPDRYAIVTAPGKAKVMLNCSDARPLNRYLLAELVNGLRERGAAVIVLDVELGPALNVVAADESEALRAALWKPSTDGVNIVYARPADFVSTETNSGVLKVALRSSIEFDGSTRGDSANSKVSAGVALPAPGTPIRRYPKCVYDITHDEQATPSVPYLVASLIDNSHINTEKLCADKKSITSSAHADAHEKSFEPPRIHFTIPSLRAHQDETRDYDDFKQWSVYRHVFNRCLASRFWDESSQCSEATMYRGKVVVIGASNPIRRDQHYTPIGSMAGPEIIINAIRSFRLYPSEQEKTVLQAILAKVTIVIECGFIWFIYFCLRFAPALVRSGTSCMSRAGISLAIFMGFSFALAAVLLLTFKASYSSFSVLIAVLAIAIEQYVHFMSKYVLHPFEERLKTSFPHLGDWVRRSSTDGLESEK